MKKSAFRRTGRCAAGTGRAGTSVKESRGRWEPVRAGGALSLWSRGGEQQ
ncbi:MAG: hypothetical protein ACLRK4_20580 [Ruthenibacterium lactatiformans]